MTRKDKCSHIKKIKLFQHILNDFIACLNANKYAPKAAMLGVEMNKELQMLINKLECEKGN